MEMTALELSELLGGKLEGQPDLVINRPARIEEGKSGDVSFIANKKYVDFAYSTNASVLIVSDKLDFVSDAHPTLIRVSDPYISWAQLLEKIEAEQEPESATGISPLAYIHPSAQIDPDAFVGAFSFVNKGCVIGKGTRIHNHVSLGKNVNIGQNSLLYPGTSIYADCKIGDGCILHSGVVIGSDGFGFARKADGSYGKIPQLGNVIIEDGVEIGANCAIDRATVGSTRIKPGAKLDNLIQVAHNCTIGSYTVIAAQAGISGSTKIGNFSQIGGQAGIVGHLDIAEGARINAQSGVTKSIKQKGAAVTGSPAYEYRKALRSQALERKLPEMRERIRQLELKLEMLVNAKKNDG